MEGEKKLHLSTHQVLGAFLSHFMQILTPQSSDIGIMVFISQMRKLISRCKP